MEAFKELVFLLKSGFKSKNRFHIQEIATFLSIPLVVIFLLIFGNQNSFNGITKNILGITFKNNHDFTFWFQVFITLSSFVYLIGIPLLVNKFFPLPIEKNYGLRIKGLQKHFKLSILLIGLMIPVLGIAFYTNNSLNQFYPRFKPDNLYEWIIFELIYLQVFIPTEFFFRGNFLFRLEYSFKEKSVWIAIIGYSIGHIFKPFPEVIGSIFAGYILGVLSLHCRSIWPGVLIHAGVAFMADFFGMLFTGSFQSLL